MSDLSDLRARHMKLRVACQSPDVPLVTEVCGFCNTSWPCDTIQALDHADALTRRLAEYLTACLDAFNVASHARENWYGQEHKP